jgi:hypothetical protein
VLPLATAPVAALQVPDASVGPIAAAIVLPLADRLRRTKSKSELVHAAREKDILSYSVVIWFASMSSVSMSFKLVRLQLHIHD